MLGPYESKVVVVGPLPPGVSAAEPSFATGSTLAELSGDWTLNLSGKQIATPLKSWEELGTPSFAGPAIYHRQFTVAAAPAGKHVYLEMARVRDYARVKLNGKDLGAHAWQPYRWDVTSALKPGPNELEIEVAATAGRGPGAPPPGAGERARSGAGHRFRVAGTSQAYRVLRVRLRARRPVSDRRGILTR